MQAGQEGGVVGGDGTAGVPGLARPQVPLLLARFLPPTFAGRATFFLPDPVRFWRNMAVYFTVVEFFVSLCSLPLAAARTNLSRASSGIHGGLLAVSLLGLVGALRLSRFAMLLHAVLAIGVPCVFVLFMVLTLTVSQGVRESMDAVVIVIFISLLFDCASGVVSSIALAKLNLYARSAARTERELQARLQLMLARGTAAVHTPASHATPPAASPSGTSAGPDEWTRAARLAGLMEMVVDGGVVPPPNYGTIATLPPPPPAAGGGIPSPAGGLERAPSSQPTAQMDDGRCNICADRPRDTAFFPCGHMACASCAATVQSRFGTCHACRRPIQGTLRVYT